MQFFGYKQFELYQNGIGKPSEILFLQGAMPTEMGVGSYTSKAGDQRGEYRPE